ncbi:DUF1828 domain-containing protein [Pseudomonas citronellolis]|uniref:DUF1828 domain-containing protein n=1 Tax=Pseudomonas citronellolis TaxID=53408 RepID=UPI0009EBE3CD|nr:DUF1828 domain-containing protein [Pseudomonas citronellolis]
MECNWLINNLGFECRPVKGINHGPVLEVDTPFSFSDGEPIAFYVKEHGTVLVLSDNGDTLAHLMSIGLSSSDKRRWASLRNRLELHSLALSDAGEILASGPNQQASDLIARYLAGLMAIVEYEREALATPSDWHVLIDEVEMLLRHWRPTETLSLRPKARGLSRREHTFDFQLGSLLVDAISPNANATGGVMRKAGDILSSPYTKGREIMVVIDDRKDHAGALMERDIISSLVKSMLFTDLEKRGVSRSHH